MDNQLKKLFCAILICCIQFTIASTAISQACASFDFEPTPNNGYILFPTVPEIGQFGGDPQWTITVQPLGTTVQTGTELLLDAQTLQILSMTEGAEICFTWGQDNTECPFSFCNTITYSLANGLQFVSSEPICNPSFTVVPGENGNYEFNNTSTANAGPVEYTWYFGDESPAQSGAFASHQYESSGSYDVCLIMMVYSENEMVCASDFCQTLNIELPVTDCEPGFYPFTIDITTCCEVQFTNYAVYSITGTNNNFDFFGGIDLTTQPATYTDLICIPTGCYEIQFDYSGMNQMVEQTESIEYGSPNMTNLQVIELYEGLPWNSTFCIEGEQTNCPEFILSESFNCSSYYFGIEGVDSGEVTWNFGDDSPPAYGGLANHVFEENGVYIVTAEYTSAFCPNGATLIYTVEVECATGGCPEEIFADATNTCGQFVFFVSDADPNAQVVWNAGDGSQPFTTSGEFLHTYEEAGIYEVCAMVYSPQCLEGNEICTSIIVEECNNVECPTFINSENIDCNTLVFNINDDNVGHAYWNFGDGVDDYYYQGNPQHSYEENGVYIVTAEYFGPGCPDGITLIYTIVVECGDENCPDEIIITPGELCHQFVFEVNNWGPSLYGDILWNFGDNEGYGQNEFLHMYLEPGNFEVCAEGATDLCPSGFSICVPLEVEACGGDVTDDGCPDYIWAYPLTECGLWHFEAGEFDVAEESVLWNWGDGTYSDGNTIMDHQYTEDGLYIVELTYSSANCDEYTIIYTIEVNVCETNDCPEEIWSGAGEDCGIMLFEAGGFVEGEEFVWYFGDGNSQEGGHFITHEFEEPGTYTVCCTFSNLNCGFGQLCTTVVVEECNSSCTDVVIGLDSYVNEGGTPAIYYSLMNSSEEIIASGEVGYTVSDPFFDMMHCLPDGCYYLTVDNNNPITIGEGFNVFIMQGNNNLMEDAEIVYQDNISFTILFGVNSNCGNSEVCEASFEAIYTNSPGHIEFINNSVYDGNAEFLWSYGNGETSDGQFGNVWYDENGTYEVCLTITTANCTDTYCAPVVVENMTGDCTDNTVVITATGAFTSNTTELIEIFVAQNDIEIESWTLPYNNQIITVTYEMCLVDGCYSFNVSSDTPIQAENIVVVVTSNNEVIEGFQIEGNISEGSFVFGLNTYCTINVGDDAGISTFDAYPVPANESITVTSGNTQTQLKKIELLDMSGKIISSESCNNSTVTIATDRYASGIYVLRVQSDDEITTRRISITH